MIYREKSSINIDSLEEFYLYLKLYTLYKIKITK